VTGMLVKQVRLMWTGYWYTSRTGIAFPESQSCREEGCDGIVRRRERHNHAFASVRNSADRNSTISSVGGDGEGDLAC
jgi:hypothetical protein